jgi:hypothetical protein
VRTVETRTSQYVDILCTKEPTPRLIRIPVRTSGINRSEVWDAERCCTSWNLQSHQFLRHVDEAAMEPTQGSRELRQS